jgi:hypothetical protein
MFVADEIMLDIGFPALAGQPVGGLVTCGG